MDDNILYAIENRQPCNMKLVEILGGVVESHPELRFEQILYIFGLADNNKDLFYEESIDTLKRVEEISKKLK